MGLKNAGGKDQPMWCITAIRSIITWTRYGAGLRGWAAKTARPAAPRAFILPADLYYVAGSMFMHYP